MAHRHRCWHHHSCVNELYLIQKFLTYEELARHIRHVITYTCCPAGFPLVTLERLARQSPVLQQDEHQEQLPCKEWEMDQANHRSNWLSVVQKSPEPPWKCSQPFVKHRVLLEKSAKQQTSIARSQCMPDRDDKEEIVTLKGEEKRGKWRQK
eukprot:scaffold266782_cov15-Tisochrysis_lutea.AAC.1